MYVTGLLFCFCLQNVSPKLTHKELYVICLKINKLKICFNLLKNKESNTTEQITFSHFQRQTSIINLKSAFSETQKLTQMFLKFTWSRIVHVCSVARLCPTLCDPKDSSRPGSSVHGIFQARILEWIAISFSRRSSQPKYPTRVSCINSIFK